MTPNLSRSRPLTSQTRCFNGDTLKKEFSRIQRINWKLDSIPIYTQHYRDCENLNRDAST